jgi:hypothetical protein
MDVMDFAGLGGSAAQISAPLPDIKTVESGDTREEIAKIAGVSRSWQLFLFFQLLHIRCSYLKNYYVHIDVVISRLLRRGNYSFFFKLFTDLNYWHNSPGQYFNDLISLKNYPFGDSFFRHPAEDFDRFRISRFFAYSACSAIFYPCWYFFHYHKVILDLYSI